MGKTISLFIAGAILFAAAGCIQAPYKELVYQNPYIVDKLYNGSTKGQQYGGSFCNVGWSPGVDGQIVYDLPGMPQGQITIQATGLSRLDDGGVFVTLYQPVSSQYVDPFITKNPYLITLSTMNYLKHPRSTFALLWSMKNFAADASDDERYSDAMPEGSYQQTLASGAAALYPDESQTLTLTWMNGRARLMLDGEVVIEHDYAPQTFKSNAMKLVLGKSPIEDELGLSGVTFQKVVVAYPGM